MSKDLKEKQGDTVRIQRPPPRVFTESTGQNVWMGDVKPIDLELVDPVNTDPYNSADVDDSAGVWSRVRVRSFKRTD